jgi:hypothetical protein
MRYHRDHVGRTAFESSHGKRVNCSKEMTRQACQSCGAELSEDAKFCTRCGGAVTSPVHSEEETPISTVAPQGMNGQSRTLSAPVRILITLVVIALTGFALLKFEPSLKTEILNIAADRQVGDPLALNPAAESYLQQTWEGQTINLPVEGTFKLRYDDVSGHHHVQIYPDGSYVSITNHQNAHNPTMAELKAFLKDDQTENYAYSATSFVCTNYAVMLHDNAEAHGIRCALVGIEYATPNGGHALNAFETTDEGLVFVDDTGASYGPGFDRFAKITMGQPVSEVPVFMSDSRVSVDPTLEPVVSGEMWW